MPPRAMLLASLIALCLPGSQVAAAAECAARSGQVRVALVELYTSEGCSSCPPADRWLSGLSGTGFGTDKVVPLAFHVDYWDYIGWRDEFAKARFTERQRRAAAVNRSKVVYTPQVLLSGADYRGWGSPRDLASRLADINALPPGADIALALGRKAEGGVEISVTSALREPVSDAALYLALHENRLANEVKAGENSGRRLEHDYVVRELVGPIPYSKAGKVDSRHTLALEPQWKRSDLGIAAFVQDRATGRVLQALALSLCE